MSPTRSTLDHSPREGVRSYTPRWRKTPLTEERMERLLPAHDIPAEGPLDPQLWFGRTAPVVLEVGSGYGAAAVAYASSHPEHDLIVAEVHVPGVARMLSDAESLELTNLWVEVDDAMELLKDRIPSGSLAGVHLFFPDPWPKGKHAKRRFVQQHTLTLVADRLEPGGVLRIATDHEVYAAHVRQQVAHHGGWQVTEGERPSWRPRHGFEAKGLRAGRSIHEFALTKA
ncbi:possible S-adenosylmethionine-dependent methyltransferase [Janibacter sp. HTCC2649]|uniref:tRNA (guanosine(46)-N7)-methyltransferase TrmB n=1 Tax=Janibacter sp. HTCC2649 TaxID=313589 RepID=UPI0000670BC9|nr:tRNA (guanosine(46)-N7)-methyltransferase TrmB [Janibacter sp. HTCC2649]EAP99678.1 possible S-adenosylmethionine-dependent methyltransferase [Janibacter sp. HTCC2649]